MHSTGYPPGSGETLFHCMYCVVPSGSLHPGYCRYGWFDDSLLDYTARRDIPAQKALFFPSCDSGVSVTTVLSTLWVVHHDPLSSTSSTFESLHESGNSDAPWSVSLSPARSPLLEVHRIAKESTVSSWAPCPGPSFAYTILVSPCPFP